jgi:hypothetical protein
VVSTRVIINATVVNATGTQKRGSRSPHLADIIAANRAAFFSLAQPFHGWDGVEKGYEPDSSGFLSA